MNPTPLESTSELPVLQGAAEAGSRAAHLGGAGAEAEQRAASSLVSQQHQHIDELNRELEQRNARIAELSRQVGGHEQTIAAREAELEQLRAQIAAVRGERVGGTATATLQDAETHALDVQMREQQRAMSALQAECQASAARAVELENDLRAAEDTIHRLETELRLRSAHLIELERAAAEPQPAETMRLAETARHAALDPVPRPAGGQRLLIRRDGAAEVLHVLGRKTSIGRTSDNDVQIDAQSISRHHAVILAGPVQAIIEDLNSTNGVTVNGRRVTRHILQDGDELVIGPARFSFTERPRT